MMRWSNRPVRVLAVQLLRLRQWQLALRRRRHHPVLLAADRLAAKATRNKKIVQRCRFQQGNLQRLSHRQCLLSRLLRPLMSSNDGREVRAELGWTEKMRSDASRKKAL